jgi:hypothetical protein
VTLRTCWLRGVCYPSLLPPWTNPNTLMQSSEKDSRLRARELLLAIDRAVDRVMAKHNVSVPDDRVAAVLARAVFLEGFAEPKVDDRPLRASYVHLQETLTDMSAEPIVLDSEYRRRVERFLEAVEMV